jgi:hypothetical protein
MMPRTTMQATITSCPTVCPTMCQVKALLNPATNESIMVFIFCSVDRAKLAMTLTTAWAMLMRLLAGGERRFCSPFLSLCRPASLHAAVPKPASRRRHARTTPGVLGRVRLTINPARWPLLRGCPSFDGPALTDSRRQAGYRRAPASDFDSQGFPSPFVAGRGPINHQHQQHLIKDCASKLPNVRWLG